MSRGRGLQTMPPGERFPTWRSVVGFPALHLMAIALLCLAGFGRAMSRYFVSEDFVILDQLASRPLWSTLWQQLAGPFLNLAGGYFYRPVAMVLLLLEQRVWGTQSEGYLWVHLSLHVLNAVLLYRLVGRWTTRRGLSWGITLIFTVYPLHPNTVVFIASAATLVSGTFLLASLLLHERHCKTGANRELAASAICFGLALGAYEQAVILPLLVAGRWLLLEKRLDEPRGRRLLAQVPVLGLVLAMYLSARRAALGAVGLAPWRDEWLSGLEVTRLGEKLLENAARMAVPVYGYETPVTLLLGVGALMLLATLWGLAGPRRGGRSARLWLFGLCWMIATQVPFGFSPVVPGTGRYWYLASVGLGMMLAAAVHMALDVLRAAGVRLRRKADEPVMTVMLTIIGSIYLVLLIHYAGVYARAGELTRRISGQVADLHLADDRQVFITGAPAFLRGPREVPVAQVFHWGLANALDRPFLDRRMTVFPLPALADPALLPLLERPQTDEVWRWSQTSRKLVRARRPTGEAPLRIATSELEASPEGMRLRFRALRGARHRLVLVTRGGSGFYPADDHAAAGGWRDARLPELFLRWMSQLYGGRAYAWIEARQPDGRLAAVSRLHTIRPTG